MNEGDIHHPGNLRRAERRHRTSIRLFQAAAFGRGKNHANRGGRLVLWNNSRKDYMPYGYTLTKR